MPKSAEKQKRQNTATHRHTLGHIFHTNTTQNGEKTRRMMSQTTGGWNVMSERLFKCNKIEVIGRS
jgi:hypothetical protein